MVKKRVFGPFSTPIVDGNEAQICNKNLPLKNTRFY
jgi:hypothetical protein